MIEHAKYNIDGSIIVAIDGFEYSVPDDMGNRHRVMIAAWEADGNIIEPYAEDIDLKAYAKQKRKELEEGGFDFNGLWIASDPDSQRKIMGARILADANPDHKVQFNYKDNEFVELDAPLIIAVSNAIALHIDRMFKAQQAVIAAINETNIVSTDQVDTFYQNYGV